MKKIFEKKALDYIWEHGEVSQNCLEFRGILSGIPLFDKSEEVASNVFAGAISYASEVFGNRLIYGRGNYRKEDKQEIIEHLRKVLEILNK